MLAPAYSSTLLVGLLLAVASCGAVAETSASNSHGGEGATTSTSSEGATTSTSSEGATTSTTSSSSQGGGDPTTSSAGGGDTQGDSGTEPGIYHHGDVVSIQGDFGSNDVTKTFLGGADGMIESKTPGQSMMSSDGWSFNDLGGPTTVDFDANRGEVLFTPEDDDHYNATRRFDPGFALQEQRHFYKAHYVRNVMLLDGKPYQKSYQWKHERVNWENSVVDSDCEIKVHHWFAGGGGVLTFVSRSAMDQSTYYGGEAADSNEDWALMEMMAFTGTQGQEDGKLITRVHKNGKTVISQNKQAERIYADPTLRLRYFIEQNYFGNFGQVEDGVDNDLPRPDVRELYSDDSRVIVGNTATTGWKRIELRDSVDLQSATLRELQDWVSWDGAISLRLNAGGLPKGEHDLFLVVIDGVDADGWDVVTYSMPIRVGVD